MKGKDNNMSNLENERKEYSSPHMEERHIEKMKEKIELAKIENKKKRNEIRRNTVIATVAAAAALFVILPNTSPVVANAMGKIPALGRLVEVVTFRDYHYESERNNADVSVPKLEYEIVKDTVVEDVTSEQAPEINDQNKEKLEKSIEEINKEIQEITDQIIEEFEKFKHDELGYQDIMVKSEVLNTTSDYFTLKLICFNASGSGFEMDYFYTIDLNTGERLSLKDLFAENADYITPISEDIISQMRTQMEEDEMKHYWVDDEIEELNFKAITPETSFYVNEKGNVVICFNEGDVAPMYMGCTSFEIPNEILKEIRIK